MAGYRRTGSSERGAIAVLVPRRSGEVASEETSNGHDLSPLAQRPLVEKLELFDATHRIAEVSRGFSALTPESRILTLTVAGRNRDEGIVRTTSVRAATKRTPTTLSRMVEITFGQDYPVNGQTRRPILPRGTFRVTMMDMYQGAEHDGAVLLVPQRRPDYAVTCVRRFDVSGDPGQETYVDSRELVQLMQGKPVKGVDGQPVRMSPNPCRSDEIKAVLIAATQYTTHIRTLMMREGIKLAVSDIPKFEGPYGKITNLIDMVTPAIPPQEAFAF